VVTGGQKAAQQLQECRILDCHIARCGIVQTVQQPVKESGRVRRRNDVTRRRIKVKHAQSGKKFSPEVHPA